ncbi:4Fe-4S dicluster domain-containing protein [Clostridium tagluense]|uniref:(Fe-S)-binding protein n=1 Tax=Clostridium tagluense TaxID=360422 RepID=UPI001C0AE4DF|nr:(Fe-S)-binding protein [Clostridium tagluense]MBU3128837.1 (Fe-S)-binding protein [Clostridium tagluense]MCB2313086.1 4Fe-4S dicluster domain-containing protein [Clostridium tagluense]MCB2317805.1 4Fe-4S dicluster domain-containing protein [Clostridium tagluense]MCB2322589.1 4Fe-4S dicluster domain-containing protein [Clostridium tagluense]MCB2327635.1 4Fe-4S dicluster domain-containing protein [Clostridium tagluense]
MRKISLSEDILKRVDTMSKECIACKKCMKNCIMLDEYCSSPKELFSEIIRDREIDIKIPYSCNLCNLCSEVCPRDINQKELYLELRRYAFKNHKKAIMPLGYKVVKFHQKNSFSRFFSASSKGVEDVTSTAFIPGCSLMSYSPEMVMKTYKYLQNIIPGIKIILKCCGNPTHTMGDENGFKQYYSQLDHEIQKLKVAEIITTCPNCFISIKKNSPNLKITTVWEKINESIIPDGLLNKYDNVDIKFSLHDPCPTRYEGNTQDAVREIVEKMGIKMEEFKFSKGQTLCCGAGAMVGVTNNKLATEHMSKRAADAPSDHILTYCQTCAESLSIGEKNAVHLLDLMFNEEMFSNLIFQQKKSNTAEKWMNRYKGKRRIQKL